MSSSSRIRKYDSGYEKRKKKKRIQQLVQSQKGALDSFVVKEHQTSTEDQTLQIGRDENIGDNTNSSNNVEAHTSETDEGVDNGDGGVAATLDGSNGIETDNDLRVPFQPDMFDPRYWDGLDRKIIDILFKRVPEETCQFRKALEID